MSFCYWWRKPSSFPRLPFHLILCCHINPFLIYSALVDSNLSPGWRFLACSLVEVRKQSASQPQRKVKDYTLGVKGSPAFFLPHLTFLTKYKKHLLSFPFKQKQLNTICSEGFQVLLFVSFVLILVSEFPSVSPGFTHTPPGYKHIS